MNRTVPTSFFILLGLILITAGCHKQTDPAGDAGDMSGATISSDFPSVAQIPEFETPEIVSLTAEELAALGPANDLPAEWVLPGAFSARVFRPTRFKSCPLYDTATAFLEKNSVILANWGQFKELDLVVESEGISFVPLTDPASGQTLPQRFPLPVRALCLTKSEPFGAEAITNFAFGQQQTGLADQTIGSFTVKAITRQVRVPLDSTGRNSATVDDIVTALYQPAPNSAVILTAPKQDVERFFTLGGGDSRGALAQRLGRLDTTKSDFTFLYDFQNSLKEAIHLPVSQELADLLVKKAKAAALKINGSAADGESAITIDTVAGSAEDAVEIEHGFGTALMQLVQMREKLPEETPAELSDYMNRLGEIVKTTAKVEKNDQIVTVSFPKNEAVQSLLGDALGYFNRAIDQANQQARYQQVAQQLAFIGRAMNNTYYAKNNELPPLAIRAADGTPLLSWRVALLPAFGPEGEALYNQFKLDEPWDSENNIKLLEKMPQIYASPLDPTITTKTTYQMFASPDTPFGAAGGALKLGDIPNPGHTFMVVAVVPEKAIEWTRPDTLAFQPDKFTEIFGNIVLAAPVMGELFGAPLTGAEDEIKAITGWIMGQAPEQDEAEAPPAPAETPAEPLP